MKTQFGERIVSVTADNYRSEEYGAVDQLIQTGKEKGYVLYDDVIEALPGEMDANADLDDILAGLDGVLQSTGIEILEAPKNEKLDDVEESIDLELPAGAGE